MWTNKLSPGPVSGLGQPSGLLKHPFGTVTISAEDERAVEDCLHALSELFPDMETFLNDYEFSPRGPAKLIDELVSVRAATCRIRQVLSYYAAQLVAAATGPDSTISDTAAARHIEIAATDRSSLDRVVRVLEAVIDNTRAAIYAAHLEGYGVPATIALAGNYDASDLNFLRQAWWVTCHFRAPDGETWSGKLLRQGDIEDNAEWVVVSDRNEARIELEGQGEFIWVVPDDPKHGTREDRLVPRHLLEYLELEAFDY